MRLVEACLSNAEIGQRLYISVFTVKSHIQRICGKLGVRRRAQAVAKARSMSIL
ncbi:LuxR C-terminal-related transcriptional regulator [Pseudomonas alvandae]|uniref:LuxR C-terminal-related transcriptional regulator n=1 Tax=Pseudomonas canavaninivorans TaxID=2842348 RepID=A0ABX8Q9D1_PSECO|nr:LuxR C-terminal-related transcriptional regulator [Pseudomonas alvandae]